MNQSLSPYQLGLLAAAKELRALAEEHDKLRIEAVEYGQPRREAKFEHLRDVYEAAAARIEKKAQSAVENVLMAS